jgi:hypothetical protein
MCLRRREGRLFGRWWDMHHGTRRLLYHNGHLFHTRAFFHAGIHLTYRTEAARLVFVAVRFECDLLTSPRSHSFAFGKVADS